MWSIRGLRRRALGWLDAKRSFPAGGKCSCIPARGRSIKWSIPGNQGDKIVRRQREHIGALVVDAQVWRFGQLDVLNPVALVEK